jgi:hypothetical protein
MTNLFKNAAVFCDIHFGEKSNSELHNIDCIQYIEWFITIAKSNNCETCIFLGDYHHNRTVMNLRTMNYAVSGLELLSKNFDQIIFILGNHDLFFRDKRNIHSIPWGKHIPNITVIQHPTTMGNVVLCPWLVGEEWKTLSSLRGKYIFGHFELPTFLMNASIHMPNHGGLQINNLRHCEYAFSGHFHKRQHKQNIHYIGNAFPHNYADAWDDDRGMMTLTWGGTPVYHNWPDAPSYRTMALSHLLDNINTIIKPKQHIQVVQDIDLSYEEADFIKNTFVGTYNLREFALLPSRKEYISEIANPSPTIEPIDKIVTDEILNIESSTFSSERLLNIYNNL